MIQTKNNVLAILLMSFFTANTFAVELTSAGTVLTSTTLIIDKALDKNDKKLGYKKVILKDAIECVASEGQMSEVLRAIVEDIKKRKPQFNELADKEICKKIVEEEISIDTKE